MGLMESFDSVRQMVAGAAERLGSMRSGVAAFTSEIETLEKDRRNATGREAVRIDQRLRDLKAQRAAADHLVVEAERQAGDASARMVEASKAAVANLPAISSALQAAAQRFDQGLAEAVAALDELEAAAGPIEFVLLPTPMRRDATGVPAVNEAIRAAFQSRVDVGPGSRFETMQAKIAMVIDSAKANAVRLKQRDYQL